VEELIADSLDYWVTRLDPASFIRLTLSLSWQRIAWREAGEPEWELA
jgi:hypothetical protein